MEPQALFWVFAAAAFTLAEVLTVALVSVWFVGGAISAFLAAMLGAPLWLQIAVFVVVSGGLLAALRPIAKKWAGKRARTNADRILGEKAVVTEEIDNLRSTGFVRVGGAVWSARSENGDVISKDTIVTVRRIEGVKVFVTTEES